MAAAVVYPISAMPNIIVLLSVWRGNVLFLLCAITKRLEQEVSRSARLYLNQGIMRYPHREWNIHGRRYFKSVAHDIKVLEKYEIPDKNSSPR